GGEVQAIPNGSPNREAAMVFAQYLMSRETQELLITELAWPAVREDAYGVVSGWQTPYFDSVREAMVNAQARPNVVYWGAVQGIMADAWARIVQNGDDPESVLNDAQEQIDREADAAARRRGLRGQTNVGRVTYDVARPHLQPPRVTAGRGTP